MLAETIGSLVRRARSLGAQRWSFTRSSTADRAELHVQLLGPRELVDLLTAVGLEPDTDYWSQGGQCMGVLEYAAAEEIDELSSDLALWALSTCPQVMHRRALGALLMHDGARSLLGGATALSDPRRTMCSWPEFWEYQQSGSSSVPDDAGMGIDALRRAVRSLRHDPVTTLWRTRWRQCLDTMLTRARAFDVPHTPQHLTLVHTSLLLDRLGLAVTDRVHLGRVARQLRDDLVHHSSPTAPGE